MSTVISVLKMPTSSAFIGLLLACCFISGLTGDVPDGVVYTDLHLNAQLGSRAVLKCHFYGTPSAVYWKKGDNPSTAPNLISWVEGEPEFGSCVKDKTCEMGDDYSLIIENVSIADQGRYICRVSNYLGILIHNFTDVKILALPEEPYPFINECEETHGQNCILRTTNPVNVTCTILKYFPSVDLFFLHGNKKYSTAGTLELSNTDGTKSKSIFTTASPSEISYGCVAFNIPGSQEQRTATFTVTGQSDVATTPSSRLPLPSETDGPIQRNKYFVIKIVVPIVAVFCAVAVIFLCFTMYRRGQRRRENKNDDEATPMVPRKKIDGKLSYYDLWRLVRELQDIALLRDTLRELTKADIKEDLSEQEGYEMLCTWKENNRSGNEGEILNKVLMKVLKDDYDRAMDKFCEKRKNSSIKSYQHALEHILWNINDLKKIDKFLNELIPSRPTSVVNDSVDAMDSALKELKEWCNGHLELNPLVLLSLALERAECRSVAKTFFFIEKLPDQLTSPIEPQAIEEIVRKLTGRHCKRLTARISIKDRLGSIIAENNDFLFDTNAMITDWLRNLECSDFEKRCRFDDALIKIGRYDLLDCFGTMSHRPFDVHFKKQLQSQKNLFDHETFYDDDIPQLVKLIKCLPLDKISEFNKKTGFSADKADNVLKEELKERRENILTRSKSRKASSQEFRSLRLDMTGHTENFGSTVTDEEIDVVAQVTSADKQENLLRSLGIEVDAQQKRSFVDQLKEWRKTQAKRHTESLRQIDSTVTDEEIEDVASQVTATEKQQELLRSLDIEVSEQQNCLFVDQLKEWRTKETQGNCREAFYQSLRDIGFFDSTTLADEEIEAVASQVTSADKQQELLRSLGIEVGAQQKRSFIEELKEWRETQKKTNCHEVFYQSLKHIGLHEFTLKGMNKENNPTQATPTDKIQAQSGKGKFGFGQLGRSLFNYGNKFLKFLRTDEKTNCRKVLQESLGVNGLRECIARKSTKKLVYQVELSSIALNLLMEDVRPIIDALAIDRRTVSSYIKPVSNQHKGTKRLVLELLRVCETNRDAFCETLRCIGFVDVSRSVYFDYEPSLSELINILDCVGQGLVHDIDRFLKNLDLSPDDIEECRDSKRQIDKLKVMRLWKRQIRPVPYHYRLEIVAALRDAGLKEIANGVLSGEHRKKMPNPDVIKDICCRLDNVMRNELYQWITGIPGLKEESSTALVSNWVTSWMSTYQPTGMLLSWLWCSGYMEERKSMNDFIFNSGIHELAEEISAVENSLLQ